MKRTDTNPEGSHSPGAAGGPIITPSSPASERVVQLHHGLDIAEIPPVLTVEEAGQFLRLGRHAAYEAVRRGQIPALRVGRRWIVPRAGLERLLERAVEEGRER